MKTTRRNKGEGSITEIMKGKYKVTVTVGYDADGKQKRRSYTAATKRECLDKLTEWKRELHLQSAQSSVNNKILFAEYLPHYLEYKKTQVKYTTYYAYLTASKYVLSTPLKDMRLAKITTADINNVIIGAAKRYSASTRQQYRILINAVFTLALSEGVITHNPMEGAMRVARKRYTLNKELPTEEQVDNLLMRARQLYKESPRGSINGYLYHILLLCLSTGSRRGEIVALRWRVIDTENNTILMHKTAPAVKDKDALVSPALTEPKTGDSYRIVKVDPSVIECIVTEVDHTSDYVFASHTHPHTHIHPVSVTSSIKELLESVGLGAYHLHDLRHVYATTLLKKGVNVKIVSRRLGHSNVNITLGIYAHFLPEMDEEASLVMGSNLLKK